MPEGNLIFCTLLIQASPNKLWIFNIRLWSIERDFDDY